MKYRPVETLEARLVCATRLLLGLLLTLGPAALASAATGHGGEASLVLPNLDDVSVVTFLGGISGWTLLSYGLLVSPRRPCLRRRHLRPDPAPAGTSLDGRSQRADLRNLQDLHDHAGQVPADPGSLHRGDHDRLLLLRPGASRARRGDDPGVLPGRHRRLVRGGLVRHPHQHLGQQPHGVRVAGGQALIRSTRYRSSRASRSACC
jgi:hypothetical protein